MVTEPAPRFARRRTTALLFLLFLWPAAAVALAAAALASAYAAGSWLQIPVMVLLPLAGMGVALLLLERIPRALPTLAAGFTFFLFFAAITVGLVIAYLVTRPYLEITRFPPEENLLVRQATAFNAPGYRHFADGVILADRGGQYVDSGIDGDGSYYEYLYEVAPVVSPGWRDGDPVTLWVVTGSREATVTSFSEWDGPIQGMKQTRNLGEYGRSIETAVAAHNLRTTPDALLLRLYPQSFTALQAALLRTMQIFLAITALLGLTPLVIVLVKKEL